MIKKNVKIKIILSLVIICLLSAGYLYLYYPAYSELLSQYNGLEELQSADLSFSLTYTTPSKKNSNEKLSKDIYYGYSYMYQRDDIMFLSVTPYWDEEDLEKLADELYANKHGDEIYYVDKVIVYGTSDGTAAGSHSRSIYGYEIPVSVFNFLPNEAEYVALYEKSTINIYGVEEDTTVEDLAIVLSHEYGHHYTYFYFDLSGDSSDIETEYYKLRAEYYEDVILSREYYDEYIENHRWYLSEIAAEDYVYLMGSANSRLVLKFYDNAQKMDMYIAGRIANLEKINYNYKLCKNGMPHENVSLPLPIYVDGLGDYFYSFIEDDYSIELPDEPIGTLNLSMELKFNGKRHIFTWDQPYTDHDVIYTLIGYDMDDNLILISKTTRGDELGRAGVGLFGDIALQKTDKDLHAFSYEVGARMKFRVSITFPDGLILLSDPIIIIY